MKTTKKLLAAGITALFCCSIGSAQIIYSNDFTLGNTNDINNTAPTTANNYAGGTNTAVWLDALGTNDTGVLQQNGVDNTTVAGNSWVLPFTPQTNNIYLLTTVVDFTNYPGNWIGAGFAEEYTNNAGIGNGRFADGVAGIDFAILTENTGNVQFFSGPKAFPTAGIYNANNTFPAAPGTNILQLILNTKPTLWAIACYLNGVQLGTNFIFTAATNPTNLIHAVGLTQSTLNAPNAVQYLNFALVTTEAPFITTEPIATTTLASGSKYTNGVTVTADTNGGTLSYQWYANNAPLVNGVNNVSGANTNALVINPITSINQFTNYYVIVSNNFGMATSSLASVTVLTNPVPSTTGGPITLFSGTGSAVGSSPAFSMVAVGAPPLGYQWTTNSVAVAGATNTSIAFTNLQAGSPVTFACVVSNTFGSTNVTWTVTYSNTPTAAYPQVVLADIPFDLWRLNETNDGNGNLGAVSHDYQSGNNGVYTNVTLAETGYNLLETNETSLFVTSSGTQPSCMKLVADSDLAGTMSNTVNAEFTVEAWANCISGNGASGGAPVVSQGTLGSSSFFLGVDTNATKHYQFYVRNAAGTLFSADATNGTATDFTWHHLAGVCDEAHSNVSLYIDGLLAASATITTNSGLFESGMPVAIGAGIRAGSSDYNVPFTGNISDVAIYSHALSVGQVINHYIAANNDTVPVSFTTALPLATVPYLANQTLTIPLTAAGSGSIGYYWSNITTASVISSGSTTNTTLNVSLSIPNASTSLNGDQLELVVTNPVNSTNVTVTLFNPPAPVQLDASNPILYTNVFNGGAWTQMGLPASEANVLVGGTNSLWVDELGTNDTTGTMTASGSATSTQADGWALPFVPHPGYVYTINGAFTFTGSPGNWIGIGFPTKILTNGTDGRFNGGAPADDWMIITESSGNIQYFAGPSGGGGTIFSANSAFSPTLGSHTVQIVLDTTGTQWKASGFVDGVQKGSTFSYTVANTPTNIAGVGIAQNAAINPAFYQWNSFALSATAPGGVPPYLVPPLPPTNSIALTGTVTVPAMAYGSAPFGYYWSNNATVIASGSTNAMEPLAVNLSVPSSSLTAGQLQLVVTNAYGTNVTSITLVNPINPNPGRIQFAVAATNQLTLNWPTNLGWILQTQTNGRGVGINTNWANVTNSSTTNQVVVTMNPTNGSVFYRLIHP